MTFEQHPELFWGIVSCLSIVGGLLGHSLGSFVRSVKERRWTSR